MSVASSVVTAHDPANRSDRVSRGIAVALATYLALVTWPIWRFTQASGAVTPLVAHLVILGYTLALLCMPIAVRRAALDWLVLTIGPVMYIELRWIIAGLGAPHQDALVVAWEASLFPGNPSATLASRWYVGAVSEML